MGARVRLSVVCAVVDGLALVVANAFATLLRTEGYALLGLSPMPFKLDWSLALLAAAVAVAFYWNGLYEREAFVARPLHLWTLARASLVAFLVSAVAVYLLKSDSVDQSRFILALTFVLFLPIVGVLRLSLVDPLAMRLVRDQGPITLLIGDSRDAEILGDRLRELRGFSRLEVLAPSDLRPDIATGLGLRLDDRSSSSGSVEAVFVDTVSVGPREVFDVVHVARRRGVDVYVLSGLLGPLEGSRLLRALFHAPVARVRRDMEHASAYLFKRAFDVVGSSALLVLAAPLVAVVAARVKATSPGPVFYTQTRVGRFGVPFEFYKFRSMVVNDDSSHHQQYVEAFMAGDAVAEETSRGDVVFKTIHDPRITPIGRSIRKYSLDEIPQFWNVLKGDMSLVGPRPPLEYEVARYDEWAMKRLLVPPGITGMWQVEGRSRVSFDEMILQDLMYAKNMCLAVDIRLCLLTAPAALLGHGGG